MSVRLEIRYWSGNALRGVINIKILIDGLWDRLDLSTKVALDIVKIETIVPVDEVDGETEMSKAARSADAMQVGFSVLWEVKVDDDVNRLDINTTGEEVRADKISADAIAEIMENAVTVCLKHASVAVET